MTGRRRRGVHGWRGRASSPASERCGAALWQGRARPARPASRHRWMCLTDSDGFLFSSPPSPSWQTLQIDLFGGSWLQFPTDTLLNLCVSFPFLLTCPPALGRGHWSGPHICAGVGRGDLIFSLVQRTRFVKNVNNRLLSRTGQRGRRPLPTGNASRVFRLLYL